MVISLPKLTLICGVKGLVDSDFMVLVYKPFRYNGYLYQNYAGRGAKVNKDYE